MKITIRKGGFLNKTLFGVSVLGLIFSTLFTIVSIWNNTDWMLLERGYYTFGVMTIVVVVYLAIQLLLKSKTAGNLGKFNMFIALLFAFIAVVFMGISVRNTEWVLLEKGYYWMGLGFVTITSAMVSTTISSVVSDVKYEENEDYE